MMSPACGCKQSVRRERLLSGGSGETAAGPIPDWLVSQHGSRYTFGRTGEMALHLCRAWFTFNREFWKMELIRFLDLLLNQVETALVRNRIRQIRKLLCQPIQALTSTQHGAIGGWVGMQRGAKRRKASRAVGGCSLAA